jgi:SAM-dependent methyltransferase
VKRSPDSFNEVAELYDKARPLYPPAVVDDLFALAELRPGDRALEIGAGTGQITVPMAERGLHVTAIEPGANLAAITRERLVEFDDVEVVESRFEDYALPSEPFDLIVSATAFHWLDPTVRVTKAAKALAEGGHLAIINTRWGVGREVDAFFEKAQCCYLRWYPGIDPSFRPPTSEEVSGDRPELEDSPHFTNVQYRQYEQTNHHTTDSYLDLLRTFSDIQALTPESRDGLLDCLGKLINSDFDGSLTRTDLREMWVAERIGH